MRKSEDILIQNSLENVQFRGFPNFVKIKINDVLQFRMRLGPHKPIKKGKHG